MNDSTRRILRTLLQMIAGGGAAGLIAQLAIDVPDAYKPYVPIMGAAIVAVAQIVVEELTGKDIGIKRTNPHGG